MSADAARVPQGIMNSAYTLGDFELSIFTDGTYLADGGAMFGVVPKVMWQEKAPADGQNRILLALNSLLIRTGEHNVLVDTGIGPKLSGKRRRIHQNRPQLPDNLRAGGVDPEEIDIVINTHLHFDHCGWNTYIENGRVKPTFPNARYYVHAGEVEHGHLQLERDRISYISENYDPLIASGQMQLLHGDGEIVPGISVKGYPGHTRNMQAVMVRSGGKTACYISDLVPMLSHLKATWVMAFDLYPLETIENRKKFYAEALRENWLVALTHEPHTPLVFLDRDSEGEIIARDADSKSRVASPKARAPRADLEQLQNRRSPSLVRKGTPSQVAEKLRTAGSSRAKARSE